MYLTIPLIIMGVYFLAAVVPALFLMRYIYRHDTIEPEPPRLLLRLVFLGVLAALAAIVLETLGEGLLSALLDEGSPGYTIIFAFLVVAAAEEGAKLFFLYRSTWWERAFNYRFDGVVYAVFVSLGFAAYENIRYVLAYGLSVALPRALLAIPGHMGFAVFMGLFYGRAKLCQRQGDRGGCRGNMIAAYALSVFLHGFYDACAMIATPLATVLFGVFVIAMYIIVIRLVKRESAADHPL